MFWYITWCTPSCFHHFKLRNLQDFHGVPRAVELQLAIEAIPAPRHEVLSEGGHWNLPNLEGKRSMAEWTPHYHTFPWYSTFLDQLEHSCKFNDAQPWIVSDLRPSNSRSDRCCLNRHELLEAVRSGWGQGEMCNGDVGIDAPQAALKHP